MTPAPRKHESDRHREVDPVTDDGPRGAHTNGAIRAEVERDADGGTRVAVKVPARSIALVASALTIIGIIVALALGPRSSAQQETRDESGQVAARLHSLEERVGEVDARVESLDKDVRALMLSHAGKKE